MAEIAPFRGLLYNAKKIGELSRVVAPPYDVISREEQEKLYKRSPYNVVRLILNQEPEPYEHVARLFDEWQRDGVLVRNKKPSIYFSPPRFTRKEKQQKEQEKLYKRSPYNVVRLILNQEPEPNDVV